MITYDKEIESAFPGYVNDGEQPFVLTVDRLVPCREDAFAPLDVGLLQRDHHFAKREGSKIIVSHYVPQEKKQNISSQSTLAHSLISD